MTKTKNYILLAISFFIIGNLFAKDITSSKALEYANSFFASKQINPNKEAPNITAVRHNGDVVYYVVQYTEGWVMISANDKTSAVLGYSKKGVYHFDNQPISIKNWLKGYSKQIIAAKRQRNLPIHTDWDIKDVSTHKSTPNKIQAKSIEPLIKVKWNQSYPYNQFCPESGGNRAVVGCVAVAMAQAMSVAKYPERPNGEFRYVKQPYGTIYINYDNEEPYNWEGILSGADNKKGVARLLYQCGVSVSMSYSPNGSGSYNHLVSNALKRNFNYPNSTRFHSRDNYSNEKDWTGMLITELSQGRAVVYGGNDPAGGSGHSFNIDGYDGSGRFHVNWGWGGRNNGYFSINHLFEGAYNYTSNHDMTTGIGKPYMGPIDINISNLSVHAEEVPGTVVGEVSVTSDAENPNYSYELKGNYNIFLKDYMPSAFAIEDGLLKTIKTFTYSTQQELNNEEVIITVTNTDNNLSLEKSFNITILKATDIANNKYSEQIQIYPNPVKDKLNVVLNGLSNSNFIITNTLGQKVKYGDFSSTKTISVTDLPKGIYIIQINENNKKIASQQIIVN